MCVVWMQPKCIRASTRFYLADARSLPSRRRVSVAATESSVVASESSRIDRRVKSAIGNM